MADVCNIQRLDAYLHEISWRKPNRLRAVLYCRTAVASLGSESVDYQEEELRKAMDRRGIDVLAVYRENVAASKLDSPGDRCALVSAAEDARSHDAILVATSVDRFVQGADGKQPTEAQLNTFRELVGDVRVSTLHGGAGKLHDLSSPPRRISAR